MDNIKFIMGNGLVKMDECVLEELNWKTAFALVYLVNPALAEIINQINPNDDYTFIKASYSFGDLIIKEGQLQIPQSNGKLSSLADSMANQKIQEQLSYSPIPFSILLNKDCEVFLCEEERTIPLNILNPGGSFGTFETIDFMFNKTSSPLWNVSAGARSVFMLPKINEAFGIKRLRAHYNLSLDSQLKHLSDHWSIFKEICHHPIFTPPWKCEVLFFSKNWFVNKDDPSWSHFYYFLFKQGWQQAQYAITELKLGSLWQKCIKTIANRKLKPTPYLMDTVKHLLTIAMGLAPALRPAASDLNIPLLELQKAFIEIYELDQYIPSIMCPSILDKVNDPMYYSLSFPTSLYGSPSNKTLTSYMLDIRGLKLIIDSLKRHNESDALVQKTIFDYFHAEKDKYHDIQLSHILPEEDDTFKMSMNQFPGRSFCATSPFWRGCIRLITN